MTPQDIRRLRLKNEYQSMKDIQGKYIKWKAIKGIAPYIEEYQITLKIKSILDSKPTYRNSHDVKLIIPSDYPASPAVITMITTPFVFHPNWYDNGLWCNGNWNPSEELGDFVMRMAKTLQYDFSITNQKSPANKTANNWFISKKLSGLFPCDKNDLYKKRMSFF